VYVFASIGYGSDPQAWPVHLMHVTEAVFVVLAMACIVAAMFLSKMPGLSPLKQLASIVGGIKHKARPHRTV
jgi:hypothetical protein